MIAKEKSNLDKNIIIKPFPFVVRMKIICPKSNDLSTDPVDYVGHEFTQNRQKHDIEGNTDRSIENAKYSTGRRDWSNVTIA